MLVEKWYIMPKIKEKEMKKFTKLFSRRRAITAGIVMLLSVVISIWYIVGCGNDFNSNPNIENIRKQASATLPVPTDGSTPFDHSPNDNAFIAFTVMAKEKSFIGHTTGESVTDVAFVSVSQKIKANRVVNGNKVYKESLSHSSFKGVGVMFYIDGGNFIIRNASDVSSVNSVTWKSTANKVSEDSFISRYGHFSDSITAFVMTEDTILSSSFKGEKDGVYSYTYKLHPTKATGKIGLEMRTMAGTSSVPNFESVSFTIRLDKNWRVVETVTDCVYQIDMLGGVTCHETSKEVFSGYDQNNQIPNSTFFNKYLDADITEPIPEELTATDYVMTGLSDYISGKKPLNASLTVNSEIGLSINANVKANINLNDLNDLSVIANVLELNYGNLKFNDILLAYENDSAYVQYQDIKATGTVEEITAVANRILSLTGQELPDLSILNDIDTTSLLSNATLVKENGIATVTLPLSLGDINLTAVLTFNDGEVITFTGASATIDGFDINVIPNDALITPKLGNGYNKIAPLFNIIDDNGNISFVASVGELDINATLNLVDLTLLAKIADAEIFANLNTGDIYARYFGINAKVNFNDLPYIFNEIKPIIEKFGGKDLLDKIPADLSFDIDINKILSSIITRTTENGIAIELSISGINITAILDTINSEFNLAEIVANINGTEIKLKPSSTALDFTFDTGLEYVDLREVVDTFSDTLNNVLLSEQMSVSFSGQLTKGDTVYKISSCDIKVIGLNTAPRATANLVLDIIETQADGIATTTTHTIHLTYLDPTLVEENSVNVYFTYDSSLDNTDGNANPLKGTFTTTKANETLEILKAIYSNMPELQDALSSIIVPDENGNPTFPDLDVDLATLFNALTLKNGTLTLDLNANAILKTLPKTTILALDAQNSSLNLSIPSIELTGGELSASISLAKPQEPFNEDDFSINLDGSEINFSSINELLKMLSKTAEYRSFDISGNIGMSIGSWDIAKDAIAVRAQLDIIDQKTYAVITITRNATTVLFTSVWKDYDGVSTIYLDPIEKMLYVKIYSRNRSIFGKITESTEYKKYTIEEFTANLLPNILDIIRLNSIIEKLIPTDTSESTHVSTATVENTLLGYSYNGTNTFNLKLDLEPLIGDVQQINAVIKHDQDMNVSTLTATVGLVNVISLNLDAKLNTPYGTYQQTKELLDAEINSGLYENK